MKLSRLAAFLICGPVFAQGVQFNALNKITGSLNPTDFTALDQGVAPNNPGTATLAQLQGYILGPTGAWAGATIGVPFGGTGAQFLSGLIRGNGSLAFTPAVFGDVTSLWSGCSSTTYLRGDGLCAAPVGTGTVTTTGTPVSGNVAAFSGSTSIAPATSANVISIFTGTCNASTYLRADGACATPSGAGTVTSVQVLPPTWLTASGGPITGSGTITLAATTGLAGSQFLATPYGSTGGVGLRAIVAGDLPLIPLASGVSGIIALANLPTIPLASQVSGVLPAANGGTGIANGTNTLTITGNPAKFASPASGNIGTLEVVPSAAGSPCIATNYTANLTDNGRMLCNAASSAITFTIPANASVAYPVGTTLLFIAPCLLGTVTISINSDTLYLSPTGATGSRTLAACGAATAFKYGSTTWMIFGNGIT